MVLNFCLNIYLLVIYSNFETGLPRYSLCIFWSGWNFVMLLVWSNHIWGWSGGAMVLGKLPVPGRPTILRGWSGGAMVLGKLPRPGRPTIWVIVGQGPTALAVGAGGGCLDIFTLLYLFSPLSPSLWETVRYRLKYCLKGPLNPKQPTYNFDYSRARA